MSRLSIQHCRTQTKCQDELYYFPAQRLTVKQLKAVASRRLSRYVHSDLLKLCLALYYGEVNVSGAGTTQQPMKLLLARRVKYKKVNRISLCDRKRLK